MLFKLHGECFAIYFVQVCKQFSNMMDWRLGCEWVLLVRGFEKGNHSVRTGF